jgi:hypothetical protein
VLYVLIGPFMLVYLAWELLSSGQGRGPRPGR